MIQINFFFKHVTHALMHTYRYCRGIGPGSSLSISMLGLGPKSRTWVCSRRKNLCQKRLVFGHSGSIKWSEDKCILG